jgi:hypothetical protein
MDNKQWEKKVLSAMERHFKSMDNAIKWYNTPNNNLSYYLTPKPTPKHYVDNGKGEELMQWIELCLS